MGGPSSPSNLDKLLNLYETIAPEQRQAIEEEKTRKDAIKNLTATVFFVKKNEHADRKDGIDTVSFSFKKKPPLWALLQKVIKFFTPNKKDYDFARNCVELQRCFESIHAVDILDDSGKIDSVKLTKLETLKEIIDSVAEHVKSVRAKKQAGGPPDATELSTVDLTKLHNETASVAEGYTTLATAVASVSQAVASRNLGSITQRQRESFFQLLVKASQPGKFLQEKSFLVLYKNAIKCGLQMDEGLVPWREIVATLPLQGKKIIQNIVSASLIAEKAPFSGLAGTDPPKTFLMRAIASHDSAKNKNRIGMVRLLLAFGANPNLCDDESLTPLTRCIQWRPDLVRFLLEGGGNPNHRDIAGVTQLIHAMYLNRPGVVQGLLIRGEGTKGSKDWKLCRGKFKISFICPTFCSDGNAWCRAEEWGQSSRYL